MVVCGICKESKDSKNRWVIQEHTMDNSVMREFNLCDGCATSVLRKVILEPPKGNGEAPQNIILTRSELVDDITLLGDGTLEIKMNMDLAKARKAVLDGAENTEKTA